MTRQITSAWFAFLLTTLTFAATALPASASQAHFRAQPVAATSQARLVVRDTIFRCGPAGCAAPRGSTRPAIVCSVLAREVGELRSFSADGRSFDPAELEACNSRAR
jgi:hypothetical protein